ncbi:MAG TPA: YiiD C-terminal domain-containing protein, partial [Rhodanobacteraceae bacterium]|nr:YiiD C-terminal domain-containing protein [Rhodanobacteraceae bacterium]
GWGLVELGLRAQALACDIYVGSSELRYQEPVWNELRGVARFTQPGALARLVDAVRARGKGHVDVVCEIVGEQRPATLLTARFFARLRP